MPCNLKPRDVIFAKSILYGFVPGIMAGDGDEQDVYILGLSQ